MSKNSNLNKANKAKNDEFYTQLTDIEEELQHYESHFKGKVVYCNCDNPEWSNFWKYFEGNFERLGLTTLISTYFAREGESYCTIKYNSGIKKVKLNGDGDFRSQECIDILKTADIVVTNPPFSLFREYVGQLMEYGKKFLIIGNKNALTYNEVFPYLKSNEIWTGVKSINQDLLFDVPREVENKLLEEGKIGSSYRIVDGKVKARSSSIWFTNILHNKRNSPIELKQSYSIEKYPRFENCEGINVDKVYDIPFDYNGIIGVPISFIDKYCPNQFEIIDRINAPIVNGKTIYKRILIKRK